MWPCSTGHGWTPAGPWGEWINSLFFFLCVCGFCFPIELSLSQPTSFPLLIVSQIPLVRQWVRAVWGLAAETTKSAPTDCRVKCAGCPLVPTPKGHEDILCVTFLAQNKLYPYERNCALHLSLPQKNWSENRNWLLLRPFNRCNYVQTELHAWIFGSFRFTKLGIVMQEITWKRKFKLKISIIDGKYSRKEMKKTIINRFYYTYIYNK